jgi:SAM-dependent methyltransferase
MKTTVNSMRRVVRRLITELRWGSRAATERLSSSSAASVRFATVDEWWRLTSQYPRYRGASNTVLKDFGYLSIMRQLGNEQGGLRVLEFGHGLNPTLFEDFENVHEMWGIDDFQGLAYYPDRPAWESAYRTSLVEAYPGAHFVRGLLGGQPRVELPESYFDVVCSVSVLEELPMTQMRRVLRHAAGILRTGGVLINTHDWRLGQMRRYQRLLDAHHEAGFNLGIADEVPVPPINSLLLENPTVVMCDYHGQEGDHRSFRGHWTTILTTARKR